MTNSSGKELGEIDKAHVICLMYKLISSIRDSNNLSIGFHRNNEVREKDLTKNKTTKRNNHFRIFLKDVFGLAENQNNCIYGLWYELTLQRNSDNYVFCHPGGPHDAANLDSAARVVFRRYMFISSALYSEHIKSKPNIGTYCIPNTKLQRNCHIL